MSRIASCVLAGLLLSAQALAADSPAASAPAATPGADLDAQLAAARQKLEAAARDVAQLSSQLGESALARVQSLRTRAVLGIQLQAEPATTEPGAPVIGVSPGGPAADAGIAPGDVIVALNGAPITGPDAGRQVVERMATVKPDSKVVLKVLRAGKPKEFQVTPRARVVALLPDFNGPGPGRPGGFNAPWEPIDMPPGPPAGVGAMFEGMELADLSPALGQYFGTSQGVLVIRVPHAGDFLKLQDGDVILSIDGRVPENGSHATRILRSYQPGETLHLKIMRQKKALDLVDTLPERHHMGPGAGANDGRDDRPPMPPAPGVPPSADAAPVPPGPPQAPQAPLAPLAQLAPG